MYDTESILLSSELERLSEKTRNMTEVCVYVAPRFLEYSIKEFVVVCWRQFLRGSSVPCSGGQRPADAELRTAGIDRYGGLFIRP
jgi:hypothetical protein